ncbi:hypothetical protein DHC50_07440 [Arenibacter sp. A80]|jgi:hypothetical protein|nr:hypothetical protein [Arenibacter sp. A80]RFT57428.1 hypothetical protein D0S24_07435 [Arenibacter sp. P308M17]
MRKIYENHDIRQFRIFIILVILLDNRDLIPITIWSSDPCVRMGLDLSVDRSARFVQAGLPEVVNFSKIEL